MKGISFLLPLFISASITATERIPMNDETSLKVELFQSFYYPKKTLDSLGFPPVNLHLTCKKLQKMQQL